MIFALTTREFGEILHKFHFREEIKSFLETAANKRRFLKRLLVRTLSKLDHVNNLIVKFLIMDKTLHGQYSSNPIILISLFVLLFGFCLSIFLDDTH